MPLCFKDFFLEDIKIIIFFHFCKWTQPLIHQLSPLLQLYLLLVRQALHFHLKTRREESFWGSAAVIYGQGGNGVTGSYNWGAEKWDVDGKYTCCHNWACPAQPWQGRCCSPSGWSPSGGGKAGAGSVGWIWRSLQREVFSCSHPLGKVDVVLPSHVAVKQPPQMCPTDRPWCLWWRMGRDAYAVSDTYSCSS